MSVADVVTASHQVDVKLAGLVGAYLGDHGVPQTVESLWEMAREIYPQVRVFRDRLYEQRLKELGREAHAVGVEIKPARQDVYPMEAVYKVIADAVGLSPVKSLNTALVEVLDPDTQEVVRRRISPVIGDPNDAQLVEVVSKRVTASLGRHARAGARNLVANTAQYGYARDKVTKKPVRMGYARVLTGKENCAFCAMLASRGPVYSEDTAVRKRDGRAYHDHCDCVAVLVFQGQPWEGEEQYKRLEAEWMHADGQTTGGDSQATLKQFKENLAADNSIMQVGAVTADNERGSAPPKLGTLSRKGSKRTIKSAVSGANPTGDMDNCIRCVNAWALRRMGYDVAAAPGQPDVSAEESTRYWRNAKGASPNWVDSHGSDGALRWGEIAPQFGDLKDGAFGFIRYKVAYPHVAAWLKVDGKVYLVDPQSPKSDVEYGLENAVAGSIRWVNLFGFKPSEDVARLVQDEK